MGSYIILDKDTHISYFLYSSLDDGYLGCFYLGVIMNNAAMDICIEVSVRTYVFISLRCFPRSGISG